MKNTTYDLVIIGGGINGTAIALEAAGRGLKTFLCEKGDLACATSSASTKLIHGGLRYLAAGQLSLVAESLKDRKNLIQFAPHLVKPLTFYIPFKQKKRAYWQTKIGLWLYNHFAKLPASSNSAPLLTPQHEILNKEFNNYLPFQDCYTDDARLVIANAKKARDLGAEINTYTQLISATQQGNYWILTLNNQANPGIIYTIKTKTVINAAGPWVENIHTHLFQCESKFTVSLIQGSHLLVEKLYDGHQGYLLPTTDNRVIFLIPYLDKFTLIGTTDLSISTTITSNLKFNATSEEIDYLLKEINLYLSKKITPEQIISTWSGARALPIYKNAQSIQASKISREYKLEFIEKNPDGPYLLSVWGGKLTTHRSLAVNTLQLISKKIKIKYGTPIYSQYLNSKTNQAFNPDTLLNSYSYISEPLKNRLVFNYGADCLEFLDGCQNLADLGQYFGQGLYETEINYLIKHEWALTIEDILCRRTKLGYFFSSEEKKRLESWFNSL